MGSFRHTISLSLSLLTLSTLSQTFLTKTYSALQQIADQTLGSECHLLDLAGEKVRNEVIGS